MKMIEPTEVLFKEKIYKLKYQHYLESYNEETDCYYYPISPINCKECKAITVCFITDEKGVELFFAISCCSLHDQFSKRMGRIISRGRLLKILKIEDPSSMLGTKKY